MLEVLNHMKSFILLCKHNTVRILIHPNQPQRTLGLQENNSYLTVYAYIPHYIYIYIHNYCQRWN